MSGIGKKPALVASDAFTKLLDQLSKAALIDALWCACQLGTNDSEEEITIQAARNAVAALRMRSDRIPKDIAACAEDLLESDPVNQ